MNQHELISQVIQQILSGIPGGPIISGLLGAPAANWLSPTGSAANSFIWPGQNTSFYGTSASYINNMRTKGFSYASSQFEQEQSIRALTEYHRMLNPGMNEQELRGLAENSADNPFSSGSLLYRLGDPYGLNAAMPAAGQLSSTLQRLGSDFSLRGASYAKSISNAIYGHTDGSGKWQNGILNDVIDNPGAYGHLSAADVMNVGRELALTEQGSFNSGGSFNADRFRTRLKEVSKSLEPWKDIFGKDVPDMLNKLEALTGSGLGSYSGDIGSLGHRMAAIMDTTGANIQHIAAYKDVLSRNLVDPTMSNRSILGSLALAGDMTLGMSNYSINSMTSEELQGTISRNYVGTAKSKYADRFALAFSRWADSNGGANASISSFRDSLRGLMKAGNSHQDALLKLSGASSLSDLDMYKHSDAYIRAIQDGSAASMAKEVYTTEAVKEVLSGYNGNVFEVFSESVAKGMNGLGTEGMLKFLGMSQDQQIKQIMEWDKTITDKGAARVVANDIRTLAMRATGMSNVEEARAWFGSEYNAAVQGRRAEQATTFRETLSKIRKRGGIAGVLDKIRSSGGNASVSELVKTYTGGIDMLRPLFESFANIKDKSEVDALLKTHEDTILSGMNFAVNNYAELGEGGMYHEVGEMMQSGDRSEMLQGYRLASSLDAIGRGGLSKLSKGERSGLLSTLKANAANDKLTTEQLRNKAKDAFIDQRMFKAIGDTEGLSAHSGTSIATINELLKGEYSSKEQLRKAFESKLKGTDAEKREMLGDFDKLWKKSGIGDLDGIDPLQKIAGFLEQLPVALNNLIEALKNFKPGGAK